MIIAPGIIGLLTCLLFVNLTAIYAAFNGVQILAGWNPGSGSEKQIRLEQKTYLVSTLLSFALVCEVLAFFLFIVTVDRLHPLFIGAMCAAGSLNANAFGYAALGIKALNVILCGIWMVLNYVDNRGYDYPLIRLKYGAVPFLTALLIAEAAFFVAYWIGLDPQIITSCCSTIFNEDGQTLVSEIAHLPSYQMTIAYYLHFGLVFGAGLYFFRTAKWARIFSFASFTLFFTGLLAVISFISLYYYQLPTHHCPFCLLQREYGFIGYPLYAALFAAGISGGAIGIIAAFRERASIRSILPAIQKKLCLVSLCSHILFAGIASYPIIFSDFTLYY